MKTPHKHAELIKAWADGHQVQYKSQKGDCGWKDDPFPCFDTNYEWRIKPEPKPDLEVFARVTHDGMNSSFGWRGFGEKCANIAFTFDGETGKLKAAEVLK